MERSEIIATMGELKLYGPARTATGRNFRHHPTHARTRGQQQRPLRINAA